MVQSKEQSLFAGRASDLAQKADINPYETVAGKYLSPSEQYDFFAAVSASDSAARLFFFGGMICAERRKPVFLPSFCEAAEILNEKNIFSSGPELQTEKILKENGLLHDTGIVPVMISGSSFVSLSHRDYMGAVLGLGLDRSVIGDITVLSDCSALVFADPQSASVISENLNTVGRDTVTVVKKELPLDITVEKKFVSLNVLSSSDRLDCIVSALSNSGRTQSKETIESGFAEVNHKTNLKPDFRVSEGDIVSVRGIGKFIIDAYEGVTKKGRLKIAARKYS